MDRMVAKMRIAVTILVPTIPIETTTTCFWSQLWPTPLPMVTSSMPKGLALSNQVRCWGKSRAAGRNECVKRKLGAKNLSNLYRR